MELNLKPVIQFIEALIANHY